MTKVVRMYETRVPQILPYADMEVGDPGTGEVCIRRVAVGLSATGSSIFTI